MPSYTNINGERIHYTANIPSATAPATYSVNIPARYLADTNVCQKEVDKKMNAFDNAICCMEAEPYVKKSRTQIANAQIIGNTPVEATQRDYAIARVKALADKHNLALRKQFHMDGERPQTAVELIAAIKNDTFHLDEFQLKQHANEIKRGYFNNEFGIVWGPEPDTKGFEAAQEVLKEAAQKALDGATLKPIDALEGVIDDFKAWVYTPAK